jgi:hypothetical protein
VVTNAHDARYDVCCKAHDECVVHGLSQADQKCHDEFITCLDTAITARTLPWKKVKGCSPRKIVQTMTSGIRMASMFSNLLGGLGGAGGGGGGGGGGIGGGGGAGARRRDL